MRTYLQRMLKLTLPALVLVGVAVMLTFASVSAQETSSNLKAIDLATKAVNYDKQRMEAEINNATESEMASLYNCQNLRVLNAKLDNFKNQSQAASYRKAVEAYREDQFALVKLQNRATGYQVSFKRYYHRINKNPLAQKELSEALQIQQRQLKYYQSVENIDTGCGDFKKLARLVKEFKVKKFSKKQHVKKLKAERQARQKVNRQISRFDGRLTRQISAARKQNHLNADDTATLQAASVKLSELGSNQKSHAAFQYALNITVK